MAITTYIAPDASEPMLIRTTIDYGTKKGTYLSEYNYAPNTQVDYTKASHEILMYIRQNFHSDKDYNQFLRTCLVVAKELNGT